MKDWYGSSMKRALRGGDFHGLVFLEPLDFLKLTSKYEEYTSFTDKLVYHGKHIEQRPFREGIQFLSVTKKGKDTLEVVGHEGRHRTMSKLIELTGQTPEELRKLDWMKLSEQLIRASVGNELPYLIKFTDGYTYYQFVKDQYEKRANRIKVEKSKIGRVFEAKNVFLDGQFSKEYAGGDILVTGREGGFHSDDQIEMTKLGLNYMDVFDKKEYEEIKDKK